MNRLKILFLITFFSLLQILFSCSTQTTMKAKDISFMTEEYPPYNFKEGDQISGIASDILVKIFNKLNIDIKKSEFKIYKWADAIDKLENNPQSSLFSMTRSKNREDKYKWVGPIANYNVIAIAKKEKDIYAGSIKDLKKLDKIAVVKGDFSEEVLKNYSFNKKNIITYKDPMNIIKILDYGRVNLWIHGELGAKWLLKKNGYDLEDYDIIYRFQSEAKFYIAFNKKVPDKIISKFQQILDEIKSSGEFDDIHHNYHGYVNQ